MQHLRQSTAGQVSTIGQALDNTDGDTEENALTIANTDIKINKHNTTTLANKNSGGATSISNGVYHLTYDATDTSLAGRMSVYVHVAGALAMKEEYMVLTQSAFDALYTSTFNNLGGTAQTADHTAAIADIPTNSEFNARTIPSASYFDFTADAVQVGTNNDKDGYSISGTLNTLDELENLKQNEVVTSGPIQTGAGVVVNVGIVQNVNTIDDGAIKASTIEANALDDKGNWNIDKTGYSLTTTPPTSAQIWAEATRTLTSGANIALSKGVGLLGLNDIPASDIVTGGAINTSSGNADVNIVKINGVTIIGDGSGTPFDV